MWGFCGSRSLSPSFSGLVRRVVAGVAGPLAVGCCRGADQLVRRWAGERSLVFRASSFSRLGVPVAAALAQRSVSLVRSVSGRGGSLVAFVSSGCPSGLSPSPSPSACFCGLGSGSWASLALAVGLGVPVFVFWCSSAPPALPSSWGSWSRVAVGHLAGAWQVAPSGGQLCLF